MKAEHEAIVTSENLHRPPPVSRDSQRNCRRERSPLRQDAREANDVRIGWLSRKWIGRRVSQNVAAVADHDVGLEGEAPLDLPAKRRPADPLANDEGSGRAEAHSTEAPQLTRESARTECPMPSDVHALEKNDECHATKVASNAGGFNGVR